MAKDRVTSEKEDKLEEKLLKITRVSKTVKGGRKMSFSVLAAVGDQNGSIGIGLEKQMVSLTR